MRQKRRFKKKGGLSGRPLWLNLGISRAALFLPFRRFFPRLLARLKAAHFVINDFAFLLEGPHRRGFSRKPLTGISMIRFARD